MLICVAGKNEIAIEGLKTLLSFKDNHQLEFCACVNRNDDGVDAWQKSFAKFCRQNSIPIVDLKDIYSKKDLLFFSLEFDRIITPSKFSSKRLYNIHFSLLPAYKGMYTSILPILHGQKTSGVTFHKIDQGIDTGDILFQMEFPISENLNSRDLYDLYIRNGVALFKKNILKLLTTDEIASEPQSISGSTYYSKLKIDFSNIMIDLRETAWQVHNQIRAYAFRDYQLPKIGGLSIYKSELCTGKSEEKPGTITKLNDYLLEIHTIDYKVLAYVDQLERLIRSCEINDIIAVKEIVRNGFPVNTKNSKGWNAIIVAVYNGHADLFKFLIENSADQKSINYQGTTLLMYALTSSSRSGNMNILNEVIKIKPDVYQKDFSGRDAISYAAEYNNQNVIDLILEYANN